MSFYNKIKAHPILDEEATIVMAPPTTDVPDEDDDGSETSSTATMLQMALVGEYQQWDLYVAYASRLKGMARSGVADEFKDHAKEELEHIELLQRYLVSIGVNPTLQRKPLPELSAEATMKDIVDLQLKFERDAVALYKKILAILPDNEPLKLDIETILTKEQEHVHDLELLLKNTSVMAYFRATEPGEPTKPQAGYGQGCGCGNEGCGCGFLTKVDQAWCAAALKELRPDIYARWYQGKLLTAQEKDFVVKAISLKLGLKDKRAVLRFLDR